MKLFKILIVLILSFTLTLLTQLASAQDASLPVQQGWESYRSGEYAEAEGFFRQATQLSPDDVNALIGLGLVLWDQDKPDEAISVFQQVVQLDPNNQLASTWLESIRNNQRGEQTLIQAQIDLANEEVRSIINRIEASARAITSIRAVIQTAPNAPRTYRNYVSLGDYLLQQNRDSEELIETIHELKRLGSNNVSSDALTHVTTEKNDLDEAIDAYENAIRLKPDVADAYYGLGNALSEQGKFAKAISAYQEVIRRVPQDTTVEDKIRKTQLRLEQACES